MMQQVLCCTAQPTRNRVLPQIWHPHTNKLLVLRCVVMQAAQRRAAMGAADQRDWEAQHAAHIARQAASRVDGIAIAARVSKADCAASERLMPLSCPAVPYGVCCN